MRIEAYCNVGKGQYREYSVGDELHLSWWGSVAIRSGVPDEEICEMIYQFLNDPGRPNRSFSRSLCPGDVITIYKKHHATSYSVAGIGYRRLELAKTSTPQERGHVTRRIRQGYEDE